MNEVELYNAIYTADPHKWAVDMRNMVAFSIISEYVCMPEMLLDIGCGNGHTVEFLRKRWRDTLFYGVDLSDVAIELARQRVPDALFTCDRYEAADLPYCDIVIIMGVLEHFEDLDGALQKLNASGNLIYVECPNCLAYSDDQTEGFRQTNEGAGQNEWHLNRSSWDKRIAGAGLKTVASFMGREATTEFIWVLKSGD